MTSETPPTQQAATAASQAGGFLSKLRGQNAALPPRASARQIVAAGLGGVLAIGVVAGVTAVSIHPLILGSFGASCVILFGFHETPFAQPRNVILGHTMSSATGLALLHLFGPHGWAMALAVGIAIGLMMITRTVHPPAGSNPVIVFLTQPGWSFLILPTLLGSILLVVTTLIYLNLTQPSSYPKYWLGRRA